MPARPAISADPAFDLVLAWLNNPVKLERIGEAIRVAFDWVIDGPRTGRYSIDQLKTSEKIYIGNRVEHEILHDLELPKSPPLDTIIEGIAVDIKFSLTQNWMIPPEAIGHLCVIVSADDFRSVFNVGLFRASQQWLCKPNRDGKCGLSAAAQKAICWIATLQPLPPNFLLNLDPAIRSRILVLKTGQQRVNEVFRLMVGHPISTNAIDTLAVQRDPSKRCRDARKPLKNEGIIVCSAKYDYAKVKKYGYPPLKKNHWISIRVE